MGTNETSGFFESLWLSPLFWTSIAVGGLALTLYVNARFGFVESFLPLLGAIFAFRRLFAIKTGEDTSSPSTLSESIGVDPAKEYTDEEQLDVLLDVQSRYSKTRRMWVVLAVISVALTLYSALTVPVIAIVLTIVTGYEILRAIRTHRALQLVNDRIDQLQGQPDN
ncbi:MAG: hypothetical protein ABEJ58_10760 [Halodesulfurarchaeum sp.]